MAHLGNVGFQGGAHHEGVGAQGSITSCSTSSRGCCSSRSSSCRPALQGQHSLAVRKEGRNTGERAMNMKGYQGFAGTRHTLAAAQSHRLPQEMKQPVQKHEDLSDTGRVISAYPCLPMKNRISWSVASLVKGECVLQRELTAST